MKLEILRNTTYPVLDTYQKKIADELRQGLRKEGVWILSELQAVITRGRRTQSEDVFTSQTPVVDVDRGGLATWHGPGQWVFFCVEKMEKLFGDPRAIKKAILWQLEATCELAKLYRSDARVERGDRLGVWCDEGKLASIGVSIQNGVLQHGVSLNVYKTEGSFEGLRMCGLSDQPAYLLTPTSEQSKQENESLFVSLGRNWVTCLELALHEFSQAQIDSPRWHSSIHGS